MNPFKFKLEFTAETGEEFVPFVRKHLLAARWLIDPALKEMSVALVDDKRMSELHEQFMGVAGPTDVLTFPLETDKRRRVTAGEVVVCVPEARRAAKKVGTDARREVLLYALHGMLHLCGFDDRTDRDFERMHAKEDEILTRLGVGRVFQPRAKRRDAKPRATAARGRTGRSRKRADAAGSGGD